MRANWQTILFCAVLLAVAIFSLKLISDLLRPPPQIHFGMGPVASSASQTRLVTQSPVRMLATSLLQKPEDTVASISEEAARDPLYRVTICEAGQAAKLCVERTAQVDVLDFP